MEHAHTEDDKIKDLFEDYNPVMKSDLAFMTRLKHNIDRSCHDLTLDNSCTFPPGLCP